MVSGDGGELVSAAPLQVQIKARRRLAGWRVGCWRVGWEDDRLVLYRPDGTPVPPPLITA